MTGAPTHGLRREQLPNGVTLLVQRRRAAPATALLTLVRAGFLDEPDAWQGISHVLEHMLFKGTPSLGPGELAQRTKALGGALNAYTSYDRTVYYATVPARHAGEAAALQADQVRNPLFDAEELRRELGVIIQEARRKLDTPGAVAGETLHELLFDAHRIRRWRIGFAEQLERFTREDVAAYHASRYVPERCIVVAVGDADEEALLDQLRRSWDDWTRAATTLPAEPAETSARVMRTRRLEGEVALVDLVLGWRGVDWLAPDAPALDLAAAVMTRGRGARLPRLLREPGIVNSVHAGSYGTRGAGAFAIGADLDAKRLDQAVAGMAGTIRALREELVERDDLDRARTLLRMGFRRRLEDYESRAGALADAELAGDVTRLDREEARLLEVTPDRLREVIRRTLDPDTASAVIYAPNGAATEFDTDWLRERMKAPAVALSVVTPAPLGPVAPFVVTNPPRPTHGIHHLALPGLDLLTARHGGAGQTSLALYRGRFDTEDATTAGRTALAFRTLLRGTHRRDAAGLAVAMERLGGQLQPILGGDFSGLAATVMDEQVLEAARLMVEVLLEPQFDAADLEIERGLLLDAARAVADDMVGYPFQLAFGQAFGDRGYGAPTGGTPTSLPLLDHSMVTSWYGRLMLHGPTTVVAVGDGDPVHLAEALAPIVAPVAGTLEPEAAPVQTVAAGVRVDRRDRQQSALAMLFPGPDRRSPLRHAAETWAAIAGGLGGVLFESLRSRRSLAYSVYAIAWPSRNAGAVATYIATAPERLVEAREAMLVELDLFREAPPSPEELQRATAMLAGQAECARQSAGRFAAEIADLWLAGGELEDLDAPGAAFRRVTADQVLQVATESFARDSRAEGVLEALPVG